MYPAPMARRSGVHGPSAGVGVAYRDPYSSARMLNTGRGGFTADQFLLKKLRLRMDTDDPLFPGLKKLKMKGKDLNDLPPEVFEINELEVLDLSPEREACIDYHLTNLPPQIGQLVNLRILMLDTNQLDEIPEQIGQLTSLERISISNNRIRRLPDAFANLKRLESLHAANNRFDAFPMVICELQSLRFLDISDNLLTELPDSLARLQRLECLLLVFNRIERLPDSLTSMTNLHLLWLGNNRLRGLPVDFGRLRNLDWGFRHTSSSVVDGNPLTDPPIDICKQGVDAIDAYFRRAAGGADNDRHQQRRHHNHRHSEDDRQDFPADEDLDQYPVRRHRRRPTDSDQARGGYGELPPVAGSKHGSGHLSAQDGYYDDQQRRQVHTHYT